MTLKEFENYNKTRTMPQDWIGQGYGYKDNDFDWNNGDATLIIYIPEYAYNEDNVVKREDAYSKQDFIEICDGDEEKALYIFDTVDWQFPENLIDDWED